MSLLQFFFIIAGIIILILAIDIAKKQKFNALHFLVFLGVGGGLLVFTFFPSILENIGNIFGVARGADVLVYSSIVFLLYFVLLLLSKHVENKENITGIVRELAIENSVKKKFTGNEVFLIRVYNEEKVLKKVLKEILKKYKNVLIVNDGSKDNSRKILEGFNDKIILLNHIQNRGGGAALKTGLEYLKRYGKTKYIITFDADGQHNLDDLDKFFEAFRKDKNLDIVLGSRFIKKTKTNIPFFRKIILFGGKVFTYFLSKIYLTDSHNGYRVFKTSILDKIDIKMDGMEYASELIESIYKNKLKYKEVPVNIKYTKYSLKKGQKNFNAINIALRFIWNKFFR